MKTKNVFLSILVLAFGIYGVGQAQAIIIEAQISSVQGKAYVIQPGSMDKVELRSGMTLAQGSTVLTEENSLVGISLMPGAQTVAAADTELKVEALNYEKTESGSLKRTVGLDLKKGSVLSNLEKAGTNDFKVKTPYGVAAARGTLWQTIVTPSGGSVRVYDSMVELTMPDGKVYQIGQGTFLEIIDGKPSNIQAISKSEMDAIIKQLEEAGIPFTFEGGRFVFPPSFFPPPNPSNLKGEDESKDGSGGGGPYLSL